MARRARPRCQPPPAPICLLGGDWPAGVPAGIEFWLQTLVADPGIPSGLTISNALRALTP